MGCRCSSGGFVYHSRIIPAKEVTCSSVGLTSTGNEVGDKKDVNEHRCA